MQRIAGTVQQAVWCADRHRPILTACSPLRRPPCLFPLNAFLQDEGVPGDTPEYTSDAQIRLPEKLLPCNQLAPFRFFASSASLPRFIVTVSPA